MADQTALIQALQKRIQLLEDKQELAELLDAYCKTIDLHDFAGHANTYTVDGTQQYGPWGPLKGRQVIEKQVRQAEKDVPILQHSMTNMKFEIAGEGDRRTATGTSFLIMVLGRDAEKPTDLTWHGGPYRWTFERVQGGAWKIKTMKLRSHWINREDPVFTTEGED